jgi:hypothetical protein
MARYRSDMDATASRRAPLRPGFEGLRQAPGTVRDAQGAYRSEERMQADGSDFTGIGMTPEP